MTSRFLLESGNVSILYTGDIRGMSTAAQQLTNVLAEHWWLKSLSRLPILSPYIGGLRQLNCLYLDTTFASVNECTRDFPDRVSPSNCISRLTFHRRLPFNNY